MELYQNLFPTEVIKAPKAPEIEHPKSNSSKDQNDSPNIQTHPLMKTQKKKKKLLKRGKSSFSFLACFQCLWLAGQPGVMGPILC